MSSSGNIGQIKRRKIPFTDEIVFLCPHCENEYATLKGLKVHVARWCIIAKELRLRKWVQGVLEL